MGTDGTIGWGLNLADLDNAGFLEQIQASGPDQGAVAEGQNEYPDLLWQGQSDGTFVDVSGTVGFDDLRVNYGMVSAGVTRIREVYNLRTQSQTPSRVHFGLGDVDTVDMIRVRWPDGLVTDRSDVGARRLVTANHPERQE